MEKGERLPAEKHHVNVALSRSTPLSVESQEQDTPVFLY